MLLLPVPWNSDGVIVLCDCEALKHFHRYSRKTLVLKSQLVIYIVVHTGYVQVQMCL